MGFRTARVARPGHPGKANEQWSSGRERGSSTRGDSWASDFHSYFRTFGANPLAAAAVHEVIERERLIAKAGLVGGNLTRGLKKLAIRFFSSQICAPPTSTSAPRSAVRAHCRPRQW
jgi:hypothetical protein